MNYLFLADATAVIHFTIIVAVLGGLLWSFRHKRFRPIEAGALLIVVLLWSYYGNCPLTILEQYYRNLAHYPSNLTSVGYLPYYAKKFLDISLTSKLVQQSTFFTGGIFFAASIEWLAPVFHFEIFKLRRLFRKPKKGLTKPRRM